MCINLGYLDDYVNSHVAELRREVEHDRLVQEAMRPSRPVRMLIADWLYSAAERIEGSPRSRTVEWTA